MKTKRSYPSNGQALVEWALILPVFLLIVFVIVDLGRIVYTYSSLQNAVREGARYATVHPPINTAAQNAIVATVKHYAVALDPSLIAVTFPTPPDAKRITISATYQFTLVTPFTSIIMGSNTVPLHAQTTMQREF